MDLDPVILSRLQFAFTIIFHYIFPPFSIGMGALQPMLELDTASDHCPVPILSTLDAMNPSPVGTQTEVGTRGWVGSVSPSQFRFSSSNSDNQMPHFVIFLNYVCCMYM